MLVPLYFLLGAMFVSIDLSTVSFAQHFGHKPLAGFILGTYALGSATGGLWYGSRQWRAPIENRFALTLTLTVLGVATFWAQPNLVTLTCGIYLCGLTIAPTLIAGFSLLEAQANRAGAPRPCPGSAAASASAWPRARPWSVSFSTRTARGRGTRSPPSAARRAR